MNALIKTGQLFYGSGIIVYGVHQLFIQDFRPQIIPLFPAWAHQYSIFAVVTGLAMILFGAVVAGLVQAKGFDPRRVCLYLGFYFFALIITCHIPYLLFVYPHKLSHLGSWGDLLKGLSFCGGAFVVAGSYPKPSSTRLNGNSLIGWFERLRPLGRLFFCTTIILFGCCHFAYIESISLMVPGWIGMRSFWAAFGGIALIGAGLAIALKVFSKPVSLLLATMLFLWFLLLHVPGAIGNPTVARGNLIVSAFDALLFCGTALVLSQSNKQLMNETMESTLAKNTVRKSRVHV